MICWTSLSIGYCQLTDEEDNNSPGLQSSGSYWVPPSQSVKASQSSLSQESVASEGINRARNTEVNNPENWNIKNRKAFPGCHLFYKFILLQIYRFILFFVCIGKKKEEECFLVMWDQLLPLLSKCQTAGCASAVSEENMEKFNEGRKKRD